MRCGTEALAASKADAEWIATAGDAIDIAEMLANRSPSLRSAASCQLRIFHHPGAILPQ